MAEIEAKFVIRKAEQAERALTALRSRGYEVAEQGSHTQVDRYFDTPDWAILRAGWACRARSIGGKHELMLKSVGEQQGEVFVRDELVQRLDKSAIDSMKLPPGPVQRTVDAIVSGTARRELFRVRSRRTVFAVSAPGDHPAQMHIDLDRTRIRAKNARAKAPGKLEFTELEVELDDGTADAVDAVARVLRDDVGLTPSKFSKFERGIDAAGLEPPGMARPATAARMRPRDRVVDLFFAYLADQLTRVEHHQPRAWEGIQIEGVHKMRVAIRRLRSILRAFRDMLGQDEYKRLNGELRWLASELGKARDADVCLEGARWSHGALSEAAAAGAEFIAFLEAEQIAAYENLVSVMSGERYATLIADLRRFIDAGPTDGIEEQYGSLSIAECADTMIEQAIATILMHGSRITPDSPARRVHKLRLESKRLRYLLDFFATVQPKRWRTQIAATKKFQYAIGDYQDAVTARDRLDRFAATIPLGDDGRELLLMTGRLMQREDDRIRSFRDRFPAVWSTFEAGLV